MVNGIINVYKEKGYTSFDVVAKLRGILNMVIQQVLMRLQVRWDMVLQWV